MSEKKLIVLVGPTAVGKTALAIRLANLWSTEIVSADSRQVFRDMEIGTAQPSSSELAAVKHHFIGSRAVGQEYDAGQYGRDALKVIHQLFQNSDSVILCGGSGLYIKAVCEGFDDIPEVPASVRKDIMSDYGVHGLAWLQDEVRGADPEYFAKVDTQNPQRLVRALELFKATGKKMSGLRNNKKLVHPFAIIKAGLNIDRSLLYQRIDYRVDEMIRAGLVEEVQKLYPQRQLNALQTVGYTEIFGYLDGHYDLAHAIELIKKNTRHYAKRQLTWFSRDKEIKWFGPNEDQEIADYVRTS